MRQEDIVPSRRDRSMRTKTLLLMTGGFLAGFGWAYF
jgi:hypothetical protein